MAGHPKRRAIADALDTRRNAYFDIDPVDVAIGAQTTPSTLEYACAWVEDGRTLKTLASEIAKDSGLDISYAQLAAHLRDSYGQECLDAALLAARSRASHCIAETALEIVDAPAYDSVSVQQARARANQRNWLAERYNPREFGQSKAVNVAVSITTLHLGALQAAPIVAPVVTIPSPQPTNSLPATTE